MKKWEPKIKEMIPSYGLSLVENPALFNEIHVSTAQTLNLSKKNLRTADFRRPLARML